MTVLTLPSPDEMNEIGKKVLSRVTVPVAIVRFSVSAGISAEFVKNEMHSVSGGQLASISLQVSNKGKQGQSTTNQIDDSGLAALVRDAEEAARQHRNSGTDELALIQPAPFTDPVINYDTTIKSGSPDVPADVARSSADLIEQSDLSGTGRIRASAQALTIISTAGVNAHTRNTYGEYSVSVRSQSNKGSGWAWSGNEDFSRIDADATTKRAIEIARNSDNPVAVEPGRYTVILEPEALVPLIQTLIGTPTSFMSMRAADAGDTIYSKLEKKMPAGNKIGLQMADRRLQISHDPYDPELPFSPLASDGSIIRPTQWFRDGVLKELSYGPEYAARKHISGPQLLHGPGKARVSFTGPTMTLEEMIASTQRGIWVHRLSNLDIVNKQNLLLTGVTRDGTFLIENGKISKPVKNFRFLESPAFVLGKIEAFGVPVRASANMLAPRVRVRDFEFTSISDAV